MADAMWMFELANLTTKNTNARNWHSWQLTKTGEGPPIRTEN